MHILVDPYIYILVALNKYMLHEYFVGMKVGRSVESEYEEECSYGVAVLYMR